MDIDYLPAPMPREMLVNGKWVDMPANGKGKGKGKDVGTADEDEENHNEGGNGSDHDSSSSSNDNGKTMRDSSTDNRDHAEESSVNGKGNVNNDNLNDDNETSTTHGANNTSPPLSNSARKDSEETFQSKKWEFKFADDIQFSDDEDASGLDNKLPVCLPVFFCNQSSTYLGAFRTSPVLTTSTIAWCI